MSVVSEVAQSIHFQGEEFYFRKDEEITIVYSYKYTINEFVQLAEDGTGWKKARIWQDSKHRCALFLLEARAEPTAYGNGIIGFGDVESSS
jgi:hypothetical protein